MCSLVHLKMPLFDFIRYLIFRVSYSKYFVTVL
jgi:hypothetical protein